MDFGWLGVVGVLLVVAGLSALGFDALRHKSANLSQDRCRLPAPMPPAHLRDHTKTTGVIAAFRDFQISAVSWR